MLVFSVDRRLLDKQWCVPAYQSKQLLSQVDQTHGVRAIRDVATINSGSYVREYVDAGEPYLRVDNIRDFQLNENPEDLVYVRKDSPGLTGRSIVEEGDVLVAKVPALPNIDP